MISEGSPALAEDRHVRVHPGWLVNAEIMKIRTTNTWWLLLVGLVLITAQGLLSKGAGHHYELHPAVSRMSMQDAELAVAQAAQAGTHAGLAAIGADMMTSGQLLGVLVAMLTGVLIVTKEYHHQTATVTFLTNPAAARSSWPSSPPPRPPGRCSGRPPRSSTCL